MPMTPSFVKQVASSGTTDIAPEWQVLNFYCTGMTGITQDPLGDTNFKSRLLKSESRKYYGRSVGQKKISMGKMSRLAKLK